jgi:GT2 family glycosyltransferase
MLRQGIQRVARLAPGTARAIWTRLPVAARARLEGLIHPIALGQRGSGMTLEVTAAAPRRFDVVVMAAGGRGKRLASELGGAGHRVFELGDELELDPLARRHGILDGVVLGVIRGSRLQAEARRLGLRTLVEGDGSAAGLGAAFPAVSVVIVAYGGKQPLEACLTALERHTGWPRLELIVVDNGTRDGTSSWLKAAVERDRRLLVIENAENLGFARAANQGIRRASGEYVVLLNDDTLPAPGWLSRLVAHLERDRALGLVCPATNHIGNAAKVATHYRSAGELEQFAQERAFAHAGQLLGLDTVALFCAVMRRSLLAEIGWLDERYEVGMFEDDDLSRTLRTRGLRLGVALDAFVHHVGQVSFGQLNPAEYLAIWEANRRRFEAKWGVRWMPPQA